MRRSVRALSLSLLLSLFFLSSSPPFWTSPLCLLFLHPSTTPHILGLNMRMCLFVCLDLLKAVTQDSLYYARAKMKMADIYLKNKRHRKAYAACYQDLVTRCMFHNWEACERVCNGKWKREVCACGEGDEARDFIAVLTCAFSVV